MKFGRTEKIALICLVSLGITASFNGCKDDIILPVPRGIEGDYAGLMLVTKDFNTGGAATTDSQHVLVSFRIDPDTPREQRGTYSHVWDASFADSGEVVKFCNIPLGTWDTKDLKVLLAPGPDDGSLTCDPLLVPNSFIDGVSGTVEVGFGSIKLKVPPIENELGDSLILRQDRVADGLRTVFELVLLSIPAS